MYSFYRTTYIIAVLLCPASLPIYPPSSFHLDILEEIGSCLHRMSMSSWSPARSVLRFAPRPTDLPRFVPGRGHGGKEARLFGFARCCLIAAAQATHAPPVVVVIMVLVAQWCPWCSLVRRPPAAPAVLRSRRAACLPAGRRAPARKSRRPSTASHRDECLFYMSCAHLPFISHE